jgi:hypothetical protein
MADLKLRCTRCGWDEFKLTARQDEKRVVGDIITQCIRCGSTEQVGYLPDVDPPQLQPSREPIGEKIWRANQYK